MSDPRMAFKVIDRLFIVVFGNAEPTDAEWKTYLYDVELHGIDRTVQLVATDGGVPTKAQRRALYERLAGRSVPVAVVSGNLQVRAAVLAMSWFNSQIRAFPPTGLRDAIAYLEIPATRVDLIEREMAALRLSLGTMSAGSRSRRGAAASSTARPGRARSLTDRAPRWIAPVREVASGARGAATSTQLLRRADLRSTEATG